MQANYPSNFVAEKTANMFVSLQNVFPVSVPCTTTPIDDALTTWKLPARAATWSRVVPLLSATCKRFTMKYSGLLWLRCLRLSFPQHFARKSCKKIWTIFSRTKIQFFQDSSIQKKQNNFVSPRASPVFLHTDTTEAFGLAPWTNPHRSAARFEEPGCVEKGVTSSHIHCKGGEKLVKLKNLTCEVWIVLASTCFFCHLI